MGGGTIGAWCAYFLRQAGLDRVVLLEKDTLGQGASSRAAGVVRTQGGTPWAVRLGEWSRQFYLSQRDLRACQRQPGRRMGRGSGSCPRRLVAAAP